jgi:hypothetical protein
MIYLFDTWNKRGFREWKGNYWLETRSLRGESERCCWCNGGVRDGDGHVRKGRARASVSRSSGKCYKNVEIKDMALPNMKFT